MFVVHVFAALAEFLRRTIVVANTNESPAVDSVPTGVPTTVNGVPRLPSEDSCCTLTVSDNR